MEPSIGCRICLTQFGTKDTPEIRAQIVEHVKKGHREHLEDTFYNRNQDSLPMTMSESEVAARLQTFIDQYAPEFVMLGPYITRWAPDTCKCIIEYAWNPFTDEKSRVHEGSRVIRDCGAHGKSKDAHDHFRKLLDHNRRNKRQASAELG